MIYQIIQYNDIYIKLVLALKQLVSKFMKTKLPKFAGGYIYSRLGELLITNKHIYNTWITPSHLLNIDEPYICKLIYDIIDKFKINDLTFRTELEETIKRLFSSKISYANKQFKLIYKENNFKLVEVLENRRYSPSENRRYSPSENRRYSPSENRRYSEGETKDLRLNKIFNDNAVKEIFKLYDEYPNIVVELLMIYSFMTTSKTIGILPQTTLNRLQLCGIQLSGCPKMFRNNIISLFEDERNIYKNVVLTNKVLVFPPYVETIIESVVIDVLDELNRGSLRLYYLIVPKWNDNPYFIRKINENKSYIRHMSYVKSKLMNIKKINGESTSYGEMYFIALSLNDTKEDHQQVSNILFKVL
jgi:hypothetical protein